MLSVSQKPTELELAATEIALQIVWATRANWNYKTIKSLISEVKTPELGILVWQDVCFLLAYFNKEEG